MCKHGAREHPRDLAPGLRTADAVHAAVRVAALETELVVEADTELGEVDDAGRRLDGQRGDCTLAAEPTPGALSAI